MVLKSRQYVNLANVISYYRDGIVVVLVTAKCELALPYSNEAEADAVVAWLHSYFGGLVNPLDTPKPRKSNERSTTTTQR